METSVSNDLWQQGGESSSVVWFGDGDADQKRGGRDVKGSLGVTRMDRMRSEHIRGTMQVGRYEDEVREPRLRRFGHV